PSCRPTSRPMPSESLLPRARLSTSAMLADDHLYKHVKNQIVDTLSKGQWAPGERLPSEAKLAAHYGVGISTIRAALAELSAAGLVVRRQGKGTFVTQHDDQHSVYRFFHVV